MHSTQNQQEQSLVKCARPHWWPCRGRCKSNNGLCVSCPAAGSRISPAAVQHMQYAQQGICSGGGISPWSSLDVQTWYMRWHSAYTYDVHTEIGVWNSRERFIRDMTKWKESKIKHWFLPNCSNLPSLHVHSPVGQHFQDTTLYLKPFTFSPPREEGCFRAGVKSIPPARLPLRSSLNNESISTPTKNARDASKERTPQGGRPTTWALSLVEMPALGEWSPKEQNGGWFCACFLRDADPSSCYDTCSSLGAFAYWNEGKTSQSRDGSAIFTLHCTNSYIHESWVICT